MSPPMADNSEAEAVPARHEPTDLEVRSAMSRRFAGALTAERLVQHAERFGVDGIAETGAEAGLDEEALTALIRRLDEINAGFRRDPKRKALHRAPPKSAPADPARRARLLLGIPEPEPLTKTSPGGGEPAGKIGGRQKKEGAREGTKRGPGARARRAGQAGDGGRGTG